MVDCLRFEIQPVDRVPLAEGQIKSPVRVEGHGARAVQRRPSQWCPVRRRLALTGARKGCDLTGLGVDTTNAMIADVADQEPTIWRENNAVGSQKLGPGRRSAVAAEAPGAGAGHGRDDPSHLIDPPDHMIVSLDDIEVPVLIELDLVRHVQRRGRCGAAVT